MPELDYGAISSLIPQKTGGDSSLVDQSAPVQQLPIPKLPTEQISVPQYDLSTLSDSNKRVVIPQDYQQPDNPSGVADFFRKRGDKPITSGDDSRLSSVTVGDQTWNVNKEAAPYFQGFLQDLSAAGAPVRSDGGWVYREKVGAKGISEHAYGGAIDVNQEGRNEVTPGFQSWIKSNPGTLAQLENKWHIYGGERFGDLGHFEWGGVTIPGVTVSDAPASQESSQPLTYNLPRIIYPWQTQDPSTVTLGDVLYQQQQRETGNIVPIKTGAKAADLVSTVGSEFGEVDNPARGGYTEAGWNIGKWGDNLAGTNNLGVALPASALANYGNVNDKAFASNFNTNYDVQVVNPQTGQTTLAPLKDIGPAPGTGAGLDMLMGTRAAIGLGENFKGPLQYAIVPKGGSAVGANLQSQPVQTQPLVYPWQTAGSGPSPANLSNDAASQAIRGEIARGNAFVSNEPGLPAGYRSDSAQAQTPTQNTGLVLSRGDPEASARPESFGLRVGTADDVAKYNAYVAGGGDPNKIDPYDRLAILLAQNPKALLDPNNAGLLDEMVIKPHQAASAQKTLGEKVFDGISAGVGAIGDAANSVGALIRNGWNDAIPSARGLAQTLTGQKPDQAALNGMTDLNALQAQGAGKTVSDVFNMVSGAILGVDKLATGLAQNLTNDPQKKAELHAGLLNDIQRFTGFQQGVSELGDNLQSKMARAYAATGVFADLGQNLKTWKADPQAAEGVSTLAQLIGPEALAGMKAAGLFKPTLGERALEAAEDLSVARSKQLLFDSTQKVPRDVEAEAANPDYVKIRATQANLAPDARAADTAFQQASDALTQKLTTQGKIDTDPGVATGFAHGVLNSIGGAAGLIGGATEKLNSLGDRTLNALSLGNPSLRGVLEKMGSALMFGHLAMHGHAFMGRLAEMGLDAMEHSEVIPKAASQLRDFIKTMGSELAYGETSIPYWTRVSQGTRLLSPRMAAFLDSPAMQAIGTAVKGAPAGAATGAFLGALGDPDNPMQAAIANAIPGGLYGMAGGGFGQWRRFGSPQEAFLQARGDWKRTLDMFAGSERDNFLKLAPKDQLMLSTYLQQAPGLRVNFANEPAGVAGKFDPHIHTFDGADKPAITINMANPEGTIRAVFAHELMHATQTAGMTPDIYDALLGNVDRGEPGQFTALDAKGRPLEVDPATGRYTTNQVFQNFKNDYVTSLARSGEPTSHLSDLDIAREMFAEHGVDYLLSARGAVDATSAFRPAWLNDNMLKNAYAAMGFNFDGQGNLVRGTNLFEGVQRNSAIDRLAQTFFGTRFRDRSINSEELPTRNFTKEDLRTGNSADTFLDTAPEIMRNPDGSVMRDPRGMPLMRTPAQVRQYNAKLANDTLDRINALSEDQKNDIGYKILPNGNVFVRYLPQEMRDALAKTNEYNPHQIKALNSLSEALADKNRMGTNFRLFYNKALTEGKKYGSFSGTEKFAVPYGFEIAKNQNVLLRSVDYDQLNQNFMKNATRSPFKELWNGNPSDFARDWDTYFQNHARGEPGATGIGDQKRDAINALLNLDTTLNRDANPLLAARGRAFPGTRPIIKSYRIDRASQVTPLETRSPFTTDEQYYRMNRNYRPGMLPTESGVSYLPRKAALQEEAAPDKTAMPVTMRTTRTGKQVPVEIPYDIANAPLVANKQPSGLTKDSPNDFSHVDFLGKLDQQRLTHLDNSSATGAFAKKLVAEFGRWKDNPDVMDAKTWYSDVRGHLETVFGDDAELFAHLLAATSPRQGVVENWHDALEAYRRYKTGAFDDAIQRYQDTGKITEDMKPKKENGAKFGMNSDAVLKVLAGTWLDSVEGPKTPNFFDNLFGRGNDATIDMWAARTMRRLGYDGVKGAPQQWRITPASEAGVSNLDFAFSQEAFRRAADKLGMEPHELQAVLWYAEKHHWAEQGWAKGGAQAAKASYVPMLKSLSESVKGGTPVMEAITAAGKK